MGRIPAAERRAELVAAAVRVIAVHGVDGATTRRIAEQAHAPLATLHYCFATKEALFAAVLDHLAVEYRTVLTRTDIHGDVQKTARGLLRAVLQWYLENPDLGSSILDLVSWGHREGGQARILYSATFTTMRSIFEPFTADSVTPDTVDRLIFVVFALSDGFGLNALTSTDPAAARAQLESTVGMLDAWMEVHLGEPEAPTASSADSEPESPMRSLVSWVRRD
ncbi:TetR/AcrR family transcriptional regulator [Nocardia sp. NPDC051833]|uniref:TetR/AcrR family transcriptional regulator n=1 Tax=Nocardia sp. NPDC051833 TaxID=3155674 RepID=UPI003415F397